MGLGSREMMAMRAAREIPDHAVVNLGIGIPTLAAEYLRPGRRVLFHAENGLLGIGPVPQKGQEDPNIINAGGYPCTVAKHASFFDSAMSFAIIRRGLIDITILGALEVAQNGDLANWIIPSKLVPGIGGGMELAQKSQRVIALMTHVSKDGMPKIKKRCELPITAPACVDTIITDLAVIRVTKNGLWLTEIFPHTTVEEVVDKTEAELAVTEDVSTISLNAEADL